MKKILLILALIGLFGEGYCLWSHREGNKSNLKYYFGMIPDAYSPKEFSDENNLTLSYWVKAEYPAGTVSKYYEQTLSAKGWVPVDTHGVGNQGKWTSGIRVDPGSNVPVCGFTYLATWMNPAKTRLTQMTLLYYDPAPNKICPAAPKNNELLVTLQELPFNP